MDFRKSKPPESTTPQAGQIRRTQKAPGPVKGLPMQPGRVVRAKSRTPFELEQLAKLGIKEGDIVPGNLPSMIQQLQSEAIADADDDSHLPVAPDTPPILSAESAEADDLSELAPVDIRRLTPDKQKELRQFVNLAKQQDAAIRGAKFVEAAGTGVNEAIQAGLDMELQEIVVVEDEEEEPPPQPVRRAQAKPRAVPEVAEVREPVQQQVAAAKAHAQVAVEEDVAVLKEAEDAANRTGIKNPLCPHCGWDSTRPDETEPTVDEKRDFLQTVLGGVRFFKTFTLLGGAVKVTFRTLMSTESDMALQQIAFDARQGRIATQAEWLQKVTDYRMAMALDSISLRGTGLQKLPPIAENEFDEIDPSKETKAPQQAKAMYEHYLTSESIRRTVGACFHRFQRLCEKLEARMEDPDFWQGIV